jgi:hypothetical protein
LIGGWAQNLVFAEGDLIYDVVGGDDLSDS